MKTNLNNLCTYLGSFIGFIGALFMAIALGAIKEAYHPNTECFEKLKALGELNDSGMQECAEYFVVMKHPVLNLIGLILICAGFFIQFSPLLINITKRGFAALE